MNSQIFSSGRGSKWLGALGIIAATLLAYGPALRGGFIWNDSDYVTPAALRSLRGLGQIWFKLGATQQYYPILHSAFWIEHRMWGDSALGYHLLNVVLHAAAACLFAAVLRRVVRLSEFAAWLGGMVFALHPVCVESVAWISEEKNTLSTVLYLLAGLVYFRGRGVGGGDGRLGEPSLPSASYRWAALLFVLAVLSKTVAATLPGAILLTIWWREGRMEWKRDVRPLLPWFVFGAAAGLFSAWVERTYIGAQGKAFDLGLLQRCLLAGRVVWFYLGKLVWPAHLIFIYPRWTIAVGDAGAYMPLAALGAVIFWLWRRRGATGGGRGRLGEASLPGLLFFVGSLFPVLGFFNVYAFVYSFVADHWQYLASMGVIGLFAGGVDWALGCGSDASERRPYPRTALAAVVVIVLGGLTYRQSGMYRDMETFYRTTIARNPGCWMAYNNLGTLYQQKGRTADAIGEYRRALRIDGDLGEVHFNLANSLVASGQAGEAMAEYDRALAVKPVFPEAYYCRGLVWASQGKVEEAIGQYEAALRQRANFPEARNDLGNLFLGKGRYEEAAVQFRLALEVRPGFPQAHYNLGVALANLRQTEAAILEYERAIALQANYPEAENNLGAALATSGRNREAIEHYRRALQLRPDYSQARYNLELALRSAGGKAE